MQNAHELSQPIWIVTHARVVDLARGPAAPTGTPRAPRGSRRSARSARGPARAARRRVGQVVGAEHDVDVAGPLDDQLAVLLGQAAADRDLQVGPAVLERLEVPEVAVELVVGVLPDAAGVEDDDVGGLEVVGRLHALARRAARRGARSRARSSGTRRCGRGSGAAHRERRSLRGRSVGGVTGPVYGRHPDPVGARRRLRGRSADAGAALHSATAAPIRP